MKKTFYVTTPIYYTNWVPHIWHANSSLIADILKRYKKISGFDTKFLTWVDENSQKAVLKAQEAWMTTMDYLDMMAEKHKAVWDWLDIKYTDFIRTTEERHHKFVQKVLKKCFDKWDIYQGVYEWMYCIWCEWFKKEDDLIEKDWKKVCPDHLTVPEILKEKNYFFMLSKYQTYLEELYAKNPNFVNPSFRFNEVISFVNRWLEDFSVSRETNTFWIKLPFDENQVTYVWFDALFNYLTVCESPDKGWNDMHFWPADVHVVWKDIVRFHAIYWPAMLASYFDLWEEIDWIIHFKESDLEKLPTQILTTGYLTNEWVKMSKSLGNVIDPVVFTREQYNKELLTIYLLSSINIGQDWDFSEKQAVLMYNAKLANNFWNLLNRAVVLTLKLELENGLDWNIENYVIWAFTWLDFEASSIWWKISTDWFKEITEVDWSITSLLEHIKVLSVKNFDQYNLKYVLDLNFKLLDSLNTYTTQKEPWKMMKEEGRLEETKVVLYTICEWLRVVGLCLYSFFPEKMALMFKALWLENYSEILENGGLSELLDKKEIFNIKEKSDILFEKFDV